ncbi:chloramphenicol acetyltransferase [Marmoricola endophyticus]|uniref:Chloramphenicol acetyltransferase n=1 Tax=Marmoricola endophyticus TaxID=2040280 RepID=A0A917BB56_9ACTN|nr:CatA-like O-acetyltransferase [Marmoricola endophyticus]GGF32082.1 chloramphenicol acetyltransferase [Marmoricola endophyticus]
MDRPEPIDQSTWARTEHFRHYREVVPCTFAITVEVDVTALRTAVRDSGRNAYAAQVWALASVVDRHRELRMTLLDGRPATWPRVDPSFTVLNPERETFCAVWTPYDPDFATFHEQASGLLAEHRHATTMFPQGTKPAHTFDVSSLPWTSFTAFSLQVAVGDHFLPIFTLGRYVERDGRTLLPVALQVHHAATDGLHAGRALEDLRSLVGDPEWVRS